jgi:hypothetical protein
MDALVFFVIIKLTERGDFPFPRDRTDNVREYGSGLLLLLELAKLRDIQKA